MKENKPQSGFVGEPRAWAGEKIFAHCISDKEPLQLSKKQTT